jgi:dTDP-glucose 4,6-dehydratase
LNLLVTGGCGFIGSNFISTILRNKRKLINKVVNIDSLTYAGSLKNTEGFKDDIKYYFEKADLCNLEKMNEIFKKHQITHVVHLAAESHVDNSILDPSSFIQSNIVGTFNLLKLSLQNQIIRFHHVSTDEVYGALGNTGKFSEKTPYDPRNPYSASKASSDLLVKSYFHTYKLPITISNCSNNYGPRQHREKLIPKIIECLLNNKKIPLYGDGLNIRDWIFVDDHCYGIWEVFENGRLGETYCIGGDCEKTNLQIIKDICFIIDKDPEQYIQYVADRKGHDYRYAIDNNKIQKELNWFPRTSFEDGIKKTIEWYYEKN